MKHHEIELAALQDWMQTAELLYASSTAENKRLVINASGGFTLYHNKEIVWQGIQPFTAVEKYNAILSK